MKFLNFFVLLLVLVPCMAANGIANKELAARHAMAAREAREYRAIVRNAMRQNRYTAEIPMRPSFYRRTINWVSAFVESDVVQTTYKCLDLPVVAKNAFFGLADLVQSFMKSYSELFYKGISDGNDDDGRAADIEVIAQNDLSAQSTPNNEDDSKVAKVEVIAQSDFSAQSTPNNEDDSKVAKVEVIAQSDFSAQSTPGNEDDSKVAKVEIAESKAGTESACSTQGAANENSAESVALAVIEPKNAVQALETSQQSQESRADHADKGGITQLLSLSVFYCLFIGTILSVLLALKIATVESTSYWEFVTESQYVCDIVHIYQTLKSQELVDYEPLLDASDIEAVLHECFENGDCEEPVTIAMLERLLQSSTLECSLGYADDEMPEDEKPSDAGAEQHQDSTPQQPEPEQNVNEEETMERISETDTGNEEPCSGASNVSDEVLIDEFAPEIYRVNWGGNALEIFGDSQRALSSYHYGATDITEQAWALGKFLPSIHQITSAVGLYLPEINAIEGALEYIKDLELKYDPGFDTGRIEKLYSRVHSLNLSQQEIEGKDLIGLTEEIVFAANLYCSGRLKHRHSRVRYQRRVRKTYEKVTAIVKKNVEALECATEAPESIINEYCDIVGELECKICTDGLFRQLYADKLD